MSEDFMLKMAKKFNFLKPMFLDLDLMMLLVLRIVPIRRKFSESLRLLQIKEV